MIPKMKSWFLSKSLKIRIITIILIGLSIWFIYSKFTGPKTTDVKYQTASVERKTLIIAVIGSGQVSTANNGTITTLATGVISKLYVKDGDIVKTGDKIAEVDLDLTGKQNATQAMASYQGAKNNLEAVKANKYSLQSAMFTDWKIFMEIAQNSTYQNEDGSPNNINRSLPQFHIANDDWLAAEAKYKNQQAVVSQAQTALSSTWLSYQQTSPTVSLSTQLSQTLPIRMVQM